jgi:hypothetical protein
MMRMETLSTWPLLALLGLGALHGINPGMGWLFAVALGLQEQKRKAVVRAVVFLALGHALAIAAVILLAATIGLVLPLGVLKWVVAAALLTLGIVQLVRHVHPHYGGMTVGPRELTIWSFLMATVHGAGLMALPLVLSATESMGGGGAGGSGGDPAGAVSGGADATLAGAHHAHLEPTHLAGPGGDQLVALLSTVAHTAGYVIATALVAAIVYEKVGLRMLGRLWLNVRVIWAVALIVTALLTPLLG